MSKKTNVSTNTKEEIIESVDETINTIEEQIEEQKPTIATEKPSFFKRVGGFIGDKANKAKTWVKENPGKTAAIVTVAAVATKVVLDKTSKQPIEADFVELKPQLELDFNTETENYVSTEEESYDDTHYDDYETVIEEVTVEE